MKLFSHWRDFVNLIISSKFNSICQLYKSMKNAMNSYCSVTKILTSSPIGMQLTPLQYDVSQGVFYRNITWYPSQHQVGQQLYCFKAVDSVGYASKREYHMSFFFNVHLLHFE